MASSVEKRSSESEIPSTAVGLELLEHAERVAEATGGVAGEQGQRLFRDDDRLGCRSATQNCRDLLDARSLEVEAVAAVDDRRRDLLRIGRREDEERVRRWLLERLEKRIPGRRREHVRLVEDVDLAVAGDRREADRLAQRTDVIDRVR
jgi:hypothetical protein